jgi:hypothetical protein
MTNAGAVGENVWMRLFRKAHWRWWRILLTALVLMVGGWETLTGMAGMLSDPGPGGDTAAFRNAKDRGALMFLLVPIGVVLLLALMHLPALRSRQRQHPPGA